jgi:hypothetical protein
MLLVRFAVRLALMAEPSQDDVDGRNNNGCGHQHVVDPSKGRSNYATVWTSCPELVVRRFDIRACVGLVIWAEVRRLQLAPNIVKQRFQGTTKLLVGENDDASDALLASTLSLSDYLLSPTSPCGSNRDTPVEATHRPELSKAISGRLLADIEDVS